jgi:hypothetical protein
VGEHQVVVVLIRGPLVVALKLAAEAINKRDAAARPFGLRGAELAPDVVLPNPNPSRQPVHVPPAQRDQLALAQSRHGGGQVQHRLGRPERVVRGRSDQRLDLGGIEEANVRVPPTGSRLVHQLRSSNVSSVKPSAMP